MELEDKWNEQATALGRLCSYANVPEDLRNELGTPGSLDCTEVVRLATAMAESAEGLKRIYVGTMRRAGKTWQEVADALGTTRQAAQQKYGRYGAGTTRN